MYGENEWFWQHATRRLAIYLESLKAVPSRTEIAFDAVKETLEEHGERITEAVKDVADWGDRALDVLKAGGLIVGGVIGVVVVIPPIIPRVSRLTESRTTQPTDRETDDAQTRRRTMNDDDNIPISEPIDVLLAHFHAALEALEKKKRERAEAKPETPPDVPSFEVY